MNYQNHFLTVNPEKEEFVTVDGQTFGCYGIVTELVTGQLFEEGDDDGQEEIDRRA